MSKSVDERVVSMEFDNRDFEKNVAITLVTLDKLKESLKLDGATKGLTEVGKAADNLDLSHISTSAEEVGYQFTFMEKVATAAIFRITNAVIDLGHKMISNLVSPITQGGLTRAMNIEQASFQLEGLGIERSNKAVSYYDEVMQAVLGTAYSYDVAAKAASQLAASNIGVTETTKTLSNGTVKVTKHMNGEMTEALLGMAGVASMTGSDFDSIAQIFTRVAGQGRVMANDLNSLASRGLNAAATLGDYLGVTEAEVREMVRHGEIDFKIFSNAMSDAFGAHAKDSTKMFTGAVEDTKAALARIGADFYGPFLNSARDFMNALTPLVDAFHEKLGDKKDKDGNTVSGVITNVTNLVDKASRKVQGLMGAMSYSLNILNTEGRAWNLHGQTIFRAIQEFENKGDDYIKVIDGVADHFGMTRDELFQAVNDGEISLYQFRVAMFKVAKSLDGIDTKNVKNAIWDVWNAVRDNRDQYERVSDSLGNSTKAVHKAITTLSHDFNLIYKDGTHKAIDVMAILEDQTGQTREEIEKLINSGKFGFRELRSILDNAAEDYGYDLVAVQENLGVISKDYIATNKNTISTIQNTKSYFTLLSSVLNVLKTVGKVLLTVFKAAWNIIYPIAKLIFDITGAIAQGISDAIDSVGHEEWGSKLIENIKDFGSHLTLTEEQLTNISGIVKGIMSTLFFGATLAGKVFDIVLKVIKGMLGLNSGDLVELLGKLGDALMQLKTDIFGSKGLAINFDMLIGTMTDVIKAASKMIDKFWKLDDVRKIVARIREILKGWYDAGINIVQGLIQGIKDGKSKLFNVLRDIGKFVLDVIKSVLGIHSPSRETYKLGKYTIMGFVEGIKDTISDVFPTLGAAFEKVVGFIRNFFTSIDWGQIVAVILSIVNVVLVRNLLRIVTTLTSPLTKLSSVLGSFSGLLSSTSKFLKTARINLIVKAFKEAVLALLLLVGGLILIAKITDYDDLKKAGLILSALSTIVLVVAGVLALIKNKLPPAITGAEKALVSFRPTGILAFAAALLLVTFALAKVAKIDPNRLWDSVNVLLIFIAVMIAFVGGFSLIEKFDAAGFAAATKALLSFAAAILIITIAMKRIAKMSVEDIIKAGLVIAGIEALFVAYILAVNTIGLLTGANTEKAEANLLKLAGAMLIMMLVIKIASKFSVEDLKRAGMVLLGLLAFFAILTEIAMIDPVAINNAAILFGAIGGAVLLLSFALKRLSKIGYWDLGKSLLALIVIMATFIVTVNAMKYGVEGGMQAAIIIVSMAIALNLLATAMVLLKTVDWGAWLKAMGALIVIAGSMFALMLVIKSVGANTTKSLIVLLATISLLIGAVIALSFVKAEKLLPAVGSIVAILGALALAVFALGALNKAGSMGKEGLITTLLLLAGITAVMIALSKLANTKKALEAAKGIALVMISMAAALAVASLLGAVGAIGAGVIALMAAVVFGLAAIFVYMSKHLDADAAVKMAESMKQILLAMSTALIVCAVIGSIAPLALIGIGLLGVFIVAFAEFVITTGALFKKFTGLESVLDKGIEILIKLGEGIGQFGGAIVGNFVSRALDDSKESITDFLDKVLPFVEAFAAMDPATIENMKQIGESLKSFEGITFEGIDESVKTNLPKLAEAVNDFVVKLDVIDDDKLATVELAVQILKAVAKIDKTSSEGLDSFVDSLQDLPKVADCLALYILKLSVSGVTEEGAKTAKAATDILNSIGKAANTLNKFNLSGLTGEDKLAAFNQLSTVAEGLGEYVQTCKNNGLMDTTSDEYTAMENATNGIAAIVQAGSGINATGGLWQKLAGDKSLDALAEQLPNMGTGIKGFLDNLGGSFKSPKDTVTILNASIAVKKIVDSVSNLADFKKRKTNQLFDLLPTMGEKLNAIASKVNDDTATKVASLRPAFSAITVLGNMENIPDADNLKDFADAIVDFVTKVGGIDPSTITTSVSNIKNLEDGMATLGKTDFSSSLESLKNSMSSIASNSITALTSGFTDSGNAATATASMQTLLSNVVSGVKTADNQSAWKAVGAYLVDGFVLGIDENTWKAEAKARVMAKKAKEAAEKELGEQSPSKVFYRIGKFVVQGFVNAMSDGTRSVERTSTNMAAVANESFKMALESIADLENADLNVSPKITPVVDLTNASNSVDQLNAMFSRSQALQVSASMGKRQTQTDRMMSSILTGLRDSVGTHQTNNYNLNGLTYSDGSDIAQAMEVIANAVLVNGRA